MRRLKRKWKAPEAKADEEGAKLILQEEEKKKQAAKDAKAKKEAAKNKEKAKEAAARQRKEKAEATPEGEKTPAQRRREKAKPPEDDQDDEQPPEDNDQPWQIDHYKPVGEVTPNITYVSEDGESSLMCLIHISSWTWQVPNWYMFMASRLRYQRRLSTCRQRNVEFEKFEVGRLKRRVERRYLYSGLLTHAF